MSETRPQRRLLLIPVVLLLFGTVPPCSIDPEPTPVRVGLYADFQLEPPTDVRRVIQEEVAALLNPIGVFAGWSPEGEDAANPAWNLIATFHFRGRCEESYPLPRPPHPWVFGQTQVVDGHVIPYAQIDCDTIHALLTPVLASIEKQKRPALFGRAAGRVLAHELFHILASTTRHGAGGVSAASHTLRQLTQDKFRLENREIQRLRLALKLPATECPTISGRPGGNP